MISPLIKTKTHIPAEKSDCLPREHLIRRLNVGLEYPITLVSAPAGYGKTTLIRTWVHQLERPVAWLTLDDGDNDPVVFFSYFVAALQNIKMELGRGLENSLKIPQPIEVGSFLAELINQIFSFLDPFVMILDDFHCLVTPALHNAVAYLVDHLPSNMHLVISTRIDPSIPLALFRGRGQLTEIRQSDLRFNNDEALIFLRNTIGEDVDVDETKALNNRTEGWITGLKLAAMSLRNIHGRKSFIRDISGSDAFIAEYLTGVVLKQVSEETYQFLLQTSILDHLSGPLCDAVTGQAESQKTLQWLLEANFFVSSIDLPQTWFKYHQLFSDLLRTRLYRLFPDLPAELHLRASQWYEKEGLRDDAIEHAIRAGQLQRAAQLMSEAAETTLLDGRVTTFMRWMDALPKEIRQAHPLISVFYIFLLFLRGTQPGEILALLADVESADCQGEVAGEISLIRAYLGLDREQNYCLSQRALELIPLERTYFRGFAACYYGVIQMLRGELDPAICVFSEAVRASQRAGNTFLTVLGLCRLADLALIRAQLHEAEAAYTQALECAREHLGDLHPLSGEAVIGLGRVQYERGQFDQAELLLIKGVDLAGVFGETKTLVARTILAHIWLTKGKVDLAHQAILKARLIAENSTNAEIHLPVYRSSRVQFEILQGDLATAQLCLGKSDLTEKQTPEQVISGLRHHPFKLLRTSEILGLTMLEIAMGQHDQALDLLAPLGELATQEHWQREVLMIHLQNALAYRATGRLNAAMEHMQIALSLAEPEEYVRPFLEPGRPMFELLHQAAGRGLSPIFVQRLLSELRRTYSVPEHEMGAIGAQPIIDPLTARELEVLRLLKDGHTNQRMADQLIVSPGTVKKHLDNIYQKLGAHNRTEAIARARDLGIL